MSRKSCSAANCAEPCVRLKSAWPEPVDCSYIAKVPHQRPGLLQSPGPLPFFPDELFEQSQVPLLSLFVRNSDR